MKNAVDKLIQNELLIYEHLKIRDKIGDGFFGSVHRGELYRVNGVVEEVAIKSLNLGENRIFLYSQFILIFFIN